MKKLIVLLCFASAVLAACNKLSVPEPQDFVSPETYFETEAQLQTALNGVYSVLTRNATYGSNMLGRLVLDGDESYDPYSQDAYTVSDYTVSSNDALISSYWQYFYEGVNRANMILDNIGRVQMDEAKRGVIRGQALFLRAYFYLMLVSRYENIPLILHSAKTGSPADVQVPQSTPREVYEKIIADMTEASTLVEDADVVKMGGKISKSAVWGVLARACLYMAGYPVHDVSKYADARMWAEKVISSGKHELNPSYSQVFINHCQDKYDIKESIWEIEFWGNGSGNYEFSAGYVGRNNGIGNTQDPAVGYSAGMVRATRPLFNLFQTGDTRRDWAIAPFRYSGNPATSSNWTAAQIYDRYCGKWRRIYELILPRSTTRTPTNFPLLRYSDVLLMFAEADNEVNNGPTAAAYNAINQVRRRGYNKPVNTPDALVDLSGLSKSEFLEEIQDERSRELAFECLRKSDLVRWGIFLPKMKFVMNDAATLTGTLAATVQRTFTNASARDVRWPIPAYEMGVNKSLVQNPGF
ncbi:MAG: RagB/SusD family nutrient uptake outer membrane protein [Chitinophagaceae bacterium]